MSTYTIVASWIWNLSVSNTKEIGLIDIHNEILPYKPSDSVSHIHYL